jgi:hypothetical protein
MRLIILLITFSLPAFLFIIPACGDKQDPGIGAPTCDTPEVFALSGQVSYCNQVEQIYGNCTRCHKSYGTYDKAKSNADRANSKIQAGSMPPSGELPQDQKYQFKAWICEGMPECIDATAANVCWKDIKPISQICAQCHADGQTMNTDLDSYEKMKENALKANGKIQAGLMPPSGPLSDEQKQTFNDWVSVGTPEECQ